jgi:hypothetical protein
MRSRFGPLTVGISLVVVSAALRADDLTGQDQILCTPVQVSICSPDDQCKVESPWTLNIPQFVEIDLKGQKLSTTKASGENRSTPIRTILKENGEIYLQGVEAGRAFSFVIEEDTGVASIAVAREGKVVSIFGACTPLPTPKQGGQP